MGTEPAGADPTKDSGARTASRWDSAVLYGTWGFVVEDVQQPADIWHGTDDRVTPFLNGDWLARTLPDATLHEVAGGHFIIYSSWRDIINALMQR